MQRAWRGLRAILSSWSRLTFATKILPGTNLMKMISGKPFHVSLNLIHPRIQICLKRPGQSQRIISAPPAQLAIAWTLSQDSTSVPIPGTINETHLRDNFHAASIELSEETIEQLSEIFFRKTYRDLVIQRPLKPRSAQNDSTSRSEFDSIR